MPGILVICSAKRTQRELATPVVTKARLCRRQDLLVPRSSYDAALEAVTERLAKQPPISPAADMAPIRAKTPCCQHGIMAPGGWLLRIVV